MKTRLLIPAVLFLFAAGCSSVYKSGQTPDDLYYSPELEGASASTVETQYEDHLASADDRYLRMKVANRSRWDAIDDYNYWYDSRFQFNMFNPYAQMSPYGSYYSPYNNWRFYPYGRGGWNNPICTIIGVNNPKLFSGFTSGSNATAFRNKLFDNQNAGYINPKTGKWYPSENNNNNSLGSLIKRVFTPANENNGNNSFDRPARTFSNNTSNTTTTNKNAGGNSGGVKSTGSNTSKGRGGRGN